MPARSQPRNDDTGKATFSYLPPSSGRRCPEGAEAHSCYQLKKNVRYAFPRIVIPSAAEGSFSFPVSLFLRNAVCMKHRDPTSHGVRCFPLSAVLASFPDRERKRFLASARNDDTGKAAFSYLPPFSGRRCPEGTEAHSRYRLKKNVRYAFPRIVIPSAAEGSFSFPVSLFLRNAVCMKHRDPTSHGVRCFPLSAVLASFPDRERKRFLASARNDDTGKAAFSYLPPFSGRRCPEGTEAHSRYRLKKNVRYAFPRIVIPSTAKGSFSFPVSLSLRNAVCMKHRDPTSQRVRCFPLSAVLTFPDRSRTKKISRFRSK